MADPKNENGNKGARKGQQRKKAKPKEPQKPDVCDEPCQFHQDKVIKYYCSNHDDVCCSICATLNHRSCDKVAYIPDVAKGIKKTKEFVDVTKNLKVMLNQFQKIQGENLRDVQKVQTNREDFLKSVNSWRQQINNVLDKLTRNVLAEMEKVSNRETKRTKARADAFGSVIEKLQEAGEVMSENKYEGDCRCFVATKRYGRQLREFETIQKQNEEKPPKVARFEFEIDPRIRDMVQGIDSLGRVKVSSLATGNGMGSVESLATTRSSTRQSFRTNTTLNSSRTLPPIPHEHTVSLVTTIHPKMLEDVTISNITAMLALPDKRLVLVDNANNCIKLTDTEFNCMSHFKVSSAPWDIHAISKEQLVVTVPEQKKIMFFLVDETLVPGELVPTKSACYGVTSYQTQLIVTCPKDHPPCVKLMTLEGKAIRHIAHGARLEHLFKGPMFITLSKDEDVVYVTDTKFHTVIALSVDLRTVKDVFHEPNLKYPRGLARDKDGHVYIAGQWFSNLYQLDPDNGSMLQMMDRDDGLRKPQGVYYQHDTDQLYVSMTDLNVIKVFKLSD